MFQLLFSQNVSPLWFLRVSVFRNEIWTQIISAMIQFTSAIHSMAVQFVPFVRKKYILSILRSLKCCHLIENSTLRLTQQISFNQFCFDYVLSNPHGKFKKIILLYDCKNRPAFLYFPLFLYPFHYLLNHLHFEWKENAAEVFFLPLSHFICQTRDLY